MAGSALLVVFFAALTYSIDAALTWNSPVKDTGGHPTHTVSIAEGATGFAKALTIKAKTDVQDAKVTYAINPANEPFAIAAHCGTITLSKGLDFETAETHVLEIVATEVLQGDDQSGAASATATVTVNVKDVSTFSKAKASACIPDGAKAGDEVSSLDIADTFNASTVTYTITGKGSENFKEINGKIVVADSKTITKGDDDPYTLVIQQDQAVGALNLTVTVGDCSAASLLVPLGLLTLLIALLVSMNSIPCLYCCKPSVNSVSVYLFTVQYMRL